MVTRQSLEQQIVALRERADEDFLQPAVTREAGRHRLDISELGLRVSLTRSLYRHQSAGLVGETDMYAVTITRPALDHRAADPEVSAVLSAAFGSTATQAVERPSGPLVRMFRVPTPD